MVYHNNGGSRGRGGRGDGCKDFKKKKKGGYPDTRKESRREEFTKEITFKFKESKETKQFKIDLNGTNVEKVDLPIFGDESKHETMFVLNKEFNLMVEDGDLMKECNREVLKEANRDTMTVAQKKY